MSRTHTHLLFAFALALALAACGRGPGSPGGPGTGDFTRPVVLPDAPLALSNPNQDAVTWPIWGGAFDASETVRIRASLAPGGTGAAGISVAGPGEVDERMAVALIWTGQGWVLRELDAGTVIQEVPLHEASGPAPMTGEPLVLEVETDGAAVRVATASADAPLGELIPGAPLAGGAPLGLYVELEPGAALDITELAMTQPLPRALSLGTPLRVLAEARGIDIGSATDIWPPVHDLDFEALLGEQFSTAAPTEFYWTTTRGEDQDFFFVPADLMVNYAHVHGQTVTGMFLVWDFALPEWLLDLAGSGDAAAFGQVYDAHITALVERYRGQVDAWVVVNEAIWGPDDTGDPAQLAETVFSDLLGPEHIERAFRAARAAAPDAVLLYNETGAEAVGEKSDFMVAMLADLLAAGVPVDGVGLQFHIDAAWPPDMTSVVANMERIGALGLDVYITELDVSLANVSGTDDEQMQLQAELYTQVLEACLAVAACRSYTVFGFSDRYAWDELGDASPLLFTEAYQPKPAYFAIQAALE